jgi:DNA-binding response OmpR family regulator
MTRPSGASSSGHYSSADTTSRPSRTDGIELALKVTCECPDLPILLMTGYSAERQRAHNLDELICDVITKPFSLENICRRAELVMAGTQSSP